MPQPVDPRATLDDILRQHPSAARVLLARRMHCIGCAVAAFETLEEACAIYGVPLDEVLDDLGVAVQTEEEGNR